MSGSLRLEDVRFAWPDGREALQGVSFSIQPGERVALVGPNGAGKSTLILQLNGILQGSGRIEVDRTRLEKSTLGRIRAAVGVVFQDPDDQLFCPTVFEDVAFGPLHMGRAESDVRQAVESALASVGLSNYADRVPYHLSGGEKKRVAVATVLAMEPVVLVLDEPTAGLDPAARRRLIELLRTLPHTMLIATHDIPLVEELTPRTILLAAGRVAADGPTSALLSDTALLEQHGLK